MYVNTKEYSDFLYAEMMKIEEFFKKIKRKIKKNNAQEIIKDEKYFFDLILDKKD